MVKERNVYDSSNVKVINEMGGFKVIEHQKDLSVSARNSVEEYFMSKMNLMKRQVLIDIKGDSYTLQAGAMQWMSGDVTMSSGIKGVGNFIGKMVSAKVTGESTAKPVYTGNGRLMLEPTYKYILLIDVSKWGSIVLDDGLFLACESSLEQKVVARSNISSAVFGGEGLFNLSLTGKGILACESNVPMEELIEIELNDDVLKIDGNMAVAWSGSLKFTVEKSTKSLLGSAVSGEGLVNVYRGTGKVLMAPTAREKFGSSPSDSDSRNGQSQSKGAAENALGVVGSVLDLLN
ncbi:MAG: AIM24 family protein [Lachnospiraceae bacterium]|nr:AIM24 family protein [Lachnospiraceae bacterium]MDE6252527.1 AIM24 family protein [Lachnospiraceae bacterium]